VRHRSLAATKGRFDEHAERQRRAEVDDGVHGGTAVRRGVTS
jgi:hypothetical protein